MSITLMWDRLASTSPPVAHHRQMSAVSAVCGNACSGRSVAGQTKLYRIVTMT
ncbi:hypothetical protein [Sphingomonas sp. Leaf34]|uniref:hypothetical protein n=1 Tax=Sphingomonas sp. Leaf34 TaxID=1736216 RepID=UPI0012E2CE2B|nr:hypothetical protein [Sphingomonas sp. Leaf34]